LAYLCDDLALGGANVIKEVAHLVHIHAAAGVGQVYKVDLQHENGSATTAVMQKTAWGSQDVGRSSLRDIGTRPHLKFLGEHLDGILVQLCQQGQVSLQATTMSSAPCQSGAEVYTCQA